MKTLTVFTPSYNRAYTLHKCYESLLRQTSKDFTWLIIDDGSSDNTKELVDSWINENKIEINYMNRVHILETKRIDVSTDVLKGKHLTIHCIHPIEIYAAKLCALLSRTTARDLYDVYTLSKYDLFDDEEKKLLKQCLMLEYIAVNDYKLKDMKIDNIERLKRQDIKTKLLPTLKDRNPKNSNIDEMKQAVREYLKDILIVDDKTKEFYDKFQKGIYEPELLFDNEEIIERIKKHPMIIWKLNNK